MTETILDEGAVSEIEAQLADCTTVMFPITANRLRALCATVKHLREVNQGIIDGIADGKKILHDQINDLQSQLEQLRAKRDELAQSRT